MRILFDEDNNQDLLLSFAALIENVAQQTLLQESVGSDHNIEISFSFADKEDIRDLNYRYRNTDRDTDVLSFPLHANFLEETSRLGVELSLGDIVLCFQKAQEQAEAYGHSIEREIAFLTAHSVLHLLGYDHQTKQEEKIMFDKQEQILHSIGLSR